MSEIAVRFLRHVGTRAWLRIYWGSGQCPNSYGTGRPGTHNAQVFIAESSILDDELLGGTVADYPESVWPTRCDHCYELAPMTATEKCCEAPECTERRPVVRRMVFRKAVYQDPDGNRRHNFIPGDMYYADWYECRAQLGGCHHGWSNCDGRHLIVILPDGTCHPWDVDGRASNCTMKNDTVHRCWVRTGDPETGIVHVSKGPVGHISTTTCSAGSGSISVPGYHGFLHHGKLIRC